MTTIQTLNQEITHSLDQLPESTQTGLSGTRELLSQLQTVIEADDTLSDQDKADALEQVKILAEVGKNPQQESHQQQAKTAIRVLRGMIAELPDSKGFLEVSSRVLPQIAEIFGRA